MRLLEDLLEIPTNQVFSKKVETLKPLRFKGFTGAADQI